MNSTTGTPPAHAAAMRASVYVRGQTIGGHTTLSLLGDLLTAAASQAACGVEHLVVTIWIRPDRMLDPRSANDARIAAALAKLPTVRWERARRRLTLEYASGLASARVYPPGAMVGDPPSVELFTAALIELVSTVRGLGSSIERREVDAAALLATLERAVALAPQTEAALVALNAPAAPAAAPPTEGAPRPLRDLRVYGGALGESDPVIARIMDGAMLPGGVYVSRAGPGIELVAEALRAELRDLGVTFRGFDHLYVRPSSQLEGGTARFVRRMPEPGKGSALVEVGVAPDTLRAICRGEAHDDAVDVIRCALVEAVRWSGTAEAPIELACERVRSRRADVYAQAFDGYPPPLNGRR